MVESKQFQNSDISSKILIEPWITEAATMAAEMNKYIFKVAVFSDKIKIKRAVESLFKVKVISVRIINVPGKTRTRGRVQGKKSGFKKAIVTLKEGDSINIFEGK
jgi:large subunit ribosomal protein L23